MGAETAPGGAGAHFRVWAPACQRVSLRFEHPGDPAGRESQAMRGEEEGYFSLWVPEARPGWKYQFLLDNDPNPYPDPASRFQPEGPHGPSEVVDGRAFSWTDQNWPGVALEGQVLYELHVGTFTPEGRWTSATAQLEELKDCGVTVIEVMPVADFAGAFGWGYDGVNLFAPTRLYGSPDDFRTFINRAHELGLGVILDVVYNHFGPSGNYLQRFSPSYFTDRYQNDWGQAINFDDAQSGPVREYFTANARYWIEEFHLDGLRLDATQQIFDGSPEHILAVIAREVRAAAGSRSTIIVNENETQRAILVRPVEKGGFGMDGVWNDDFHHAARVALTGRKEAYYTDYRGSPQEFISAFKWGYLFQGQRYQWQKARRGAPALDLKRWQFVTFLENHDQAANSLHGARLRQLTHPGRWRAFTALLLLGPSTPMLFQGQEFGSSAPFLFFADHEPELGSLVQEGRAKFLSQFPGIQTSEATVRLPPPSAKETFLRCKLDLSERERNQEIYQLHRDLLRLRREDPVIRAGGRAGFDGAVLSADAFLLRFFSEREDRLLLVNLGVDLRLDPAPEPLLASIEGCLWKILWSSEDVRYGGTGIPPLETEENWRIPGQAALLLAPCPKGTHQ